MTGGDRLVPDGSRNLFLAPETGSVEGFFSCAFFSFLDGFGGAEAAPLEAFEADVVNGPADAVPACVVDVGAAGGTEAVLAAGISPAEDCARLAWTSLTRLGMPDPSQSLIICTCEPHLRHLFCLISHCCSPLFNRNPAETPEAGGGAADWMTDGVMIGPGKVAGTMSIWTPVLVWTGVRMEPSASVYDVPCAD